MANNSNQKHKTHNRQKPQEQKRAPVPRDKVLTGRIQGNSRGFGFLVTEGQEDLFISPRCMHGAMHNDTVEAVKVSENRGAGEAEVLKVLERGTDRFVGTFSAAKGCGFVLPDDPHYASDLYIPADCFGGATDKQKVVAEITRYPENRNPEGKIVEVLGSEGDPGVDVLSVIRSYNLYETFPKGVQREAEETSQTVSKADIAGREDFRGDLVITIDGDDSKDFDDAVCVKKGEDGLYELSVHIADVTQYVKADSKLDREAYKRGTSVYLCDRVLPMLPRELSNGICSLNEGVDRLTLSVIMTIDGSGKIRDHRIAEGVICSKNRMTYNNVAKILGGDDALRASYAHLVPMLENAEILSKILFDRRMRRGAIEFDLSESQIIVDENGRVVDIIKQPRLVSHRMIEEFMLAANETVAEHMFGLKAPFVYRAHAVPPAEKVETLTNFLSALGISFQLATDTPQPMDFAKLIARTEGKVAPVVNRMTLRSMTKATYEPVNIGHFGLAAKFYCHFTSPIRRYPDLAIHRIIKDYLHNGPGAFKKYTEFVAEASKRSSERERLAEEAERKVDDIKKAEFMRDKVGERYPGIISGVTEWGVFVELENSVEGLIRTEFLPEGQYVYNAQLMRLDSGKHSFRLGDEIGIIVKEVTGDRISFDYDPDYRPAE